MGNSVMVRLAGAVAACVGWLVSTAACGGAEPAAETPAGGATATPAGEGAEPALDENARNACDLYAREAVRCASTPASDDAAGEAAADDEGRVDVFASAEAVEDLFRERCRTEWSGDGGPSPHVMAAAIRACADTACPNGLEEWDRCLHRQFREGTVAPPAGDDRTVPGPPARLDAPRPYDPARPPCEVLSDWLLDCAAAALPDDAPDEARSEIRRQLEERLCGAPERGAPVEIPPQRLAACADAACGEMGSALMRCIAGAAGPGGPTP